MNKIMKTGILAASLIASGNKIHANENVYSKMKPLSEDKMETIETKGNGFESLNINIIRESEFQIPIPSTKTIVIDKEITKQINENKYARREMKINDTIQYYDLQLTLKTISYTFKDISATLFINTAEDEWRITVGLKKEQVHDYIDYDNQRCWRLHIKLDELKPSEGTAVFLLMREKIKLEEVQKKAKKI